MTSKIKIERNHQLGLKVSEDFYWEVKKLALKEKCHLVEVIEEAVKFTERHLNEFHQERERERERERNFQEE